MLLRRAGAGVFLPALLGCTHTHTFSSSVLFVCVCALKRPIFSKVDSDRAHIECLKSSLFSLVLSFPIRERELLEALGFLGDATGPLEYLIKVIIFSGPENVPPLTFESFV